MTPKTPNTPKLTLDALMPHITILVDRYCLFSGINYLHESFMLANSWWQAMTENWNERHFKVETASIDGSPVNGGAGMVITPKKSIDEIEKTDLIMIPPFLHIIRWKAPQMSKEMEWLRTHYESGSQIGAMCTGTFLLAQTGLLDGKTATTNWEFARSFQKRFPKVNLKLDQVVTEDDGLLCSGTANSYMNLIMRLIETLGSEELSHRCSKSLLIDPNRQSQAPYIIFERYRNHRDDKIIEAQNWLEENYSDGIVIDELAKSLGISPRHFQRRFKEATGVTPLTYLQKIRIEIAKEKLEKTRQSFGEITWDVGYEDVNSFRKLFIKHTRISPNAYRTRFTRTGA